MSDDLTALRRRILEAALAHVPFDGWSERSLRLALADCGVDRASGLRAFPRGAGGVLAFFLSEADRRMTEELSRRDLASMRVRDRVATAVRVRLEELAPHREAVRRAVASQSLPPHASGALGGLYRTVDAMWRAAGDGAADFNFYTKRALLAWVYTTTLLCWLDDDSDDFAATWAFLARRIDDVMAIQKARGRLGKVAGRVVPRPFRSRRKRAANERRA